jgi:hypothetical protein
MSPSRISGLAFSRSSAVMTSHFSFGIETTTPVPKYEASGTWSMYGVPSITCAGASVCVVQCMKVVICCERTPDFAW